MALPCPWVGPWHCHVPTRQFVGRLDQLAKSLDSIRAWG